MKIILNKRDKSILSQTCCIVILGGVCFFI